MTVRDSALPAVHAPWRRRYVATACLAFVIAVACATHAYVLSRGPRWTSPLLQGEWLFNVAATGCLFLFCAALGRRISGPLRRLERRSLDDGLATLGLGLGALSTAVLCAGLMQIYYRPVLLICFAGAVVWLRGDIVYILLRSWRSIRAWRREGLATTPEIGQRAILALLAATSLYVFMRSMLPLTDWDAVTYHVASVKLYLAHHGVFPLPDMPLAGGPSSVEMLFLLGLAAGTDGLGKVLNIGFAVLLCLSIFALARRLSGRVAGWQAVLLFATSFWMIAVLPLTLVDFASAFLLVAAVDDGAAWAERFASTTEGSRPSMADPLLLRCGLLIGCAAATKLSMLVALPVAGCSTLAVAMIYGDRRWLRRAGDACGICVLFSAAALAPVAPWLVKSWAFFGNPLYPFSTLVVSNPSHGITVDSTAPSSIDHFTWILTSIGDFLFYHVSALTLVLPLAVIVLRRPGQRFTLLFLVTGLIGWFLYVPYFEPPRYYLGLDGLAQAMSVGTLYAIAPSDRRANVARSVGVFCYLLWRAWPNLLIGLGMMQQCLLGQVVRGEISRYDYLAGQVRAYVAEIWVNKNAPRHAVIGTAGLLTGYYLDRTYLNDWYDTRLDRLDSGGVAMQAEFQAWCAAGVRLVILDRGFGGPGFDAAGVRPPQAFAWLHTPGLDARALFSQNGVDVLSVDPCRATAGARGPR